MSRAAEAQDYNLGGGGSDGNRNPLSHSLQATSLKSGGQQAAPPPEAPGEDPSSPSLLPALQAAPASLGLWPHHSILRLCQHAASPHVFRGRPLLRTPVIGSGPPCDLIFTGSLLQRPYLQRRPYTQVLRSGPPEGSEFTLNSCQALERQPGGDRVPHLLEWILQWEQDSVGRKQAQRP